MGKKPNELKMFLPDYWASTRIGNFTKIKHPIFSRIIGKPENTHLSYTLDEFNKLLKQITESNGSNVSGLRIYFISYPAEPNPDLIPSGMEDTLSLIYAPTKIALSDGKIIHVNTGDYFVKDAKNNIINLNGDVTTVKNWIQNFETRKRNIINKLLFQGQDYETQSLWYEIDTIEDAYLFLTNSDGNSKDIPPIIAIFFATYHLDEREKAIAGIAKQYHDKLTLIFSFMSLGNIDGTPYYYYVNSGDNDDIHALGGSGDTGVPCPPPPSGQTTCPGA